MSRAIYTFVDKKSGQLADIIEFELIDNPGCRAWQYAVMLNKKSRNLLTKIKPNQPIRLPTDIAQQYNNLKTIINSLSQTEFSCNFDLPEFFESVTQDLMNQLHRHFTNSCSTLWNPKYTNFEKVLELDKILQDLNLEIHNLEQYISTSNKSIYNELITTEIWTVNDGAEIGYDIFPFRKYHSYEPADLILDAYILGKTLIESFRCHDNPCSWDTAGHMRTNGGGCILLGNGRQEIYNSDAFNNWLSEYGVTKYHLMADFPLGNFVSGHRTKFDTLKNQIFNYSCHVNIQL
jgi:hypothetical protein